MSDGRDPGMLGRRVEAVVRSRRPDWRDMHLCSFVRHESTRVHRRLNRTVFHAANSFNEAASGVAGGGKQRCGKLCRACRCSRSDCLP